jgi:pimeloyl-ACP methyl ester carboxylesterase
MTATPVWFGPTERPLFGWFHVPADEHARAGVVLCPPLARDNLQAHYAIRRVAELLADAGIASLRFDYDGTGDSFGDSHDPGRVEAWLASIEHALALMRETGCQRIGLAGMRIGATLAATVAARDGAIDDLVLWDPYPAGKSYLAEQRALAALTLGISPTRPDGSLEIPGMVFAADTVAALRGLVIAPAGARLANRTLVLTRDQQAPEPFLERLASSTPEWHHATGQADLIDLGAPFQVLPHELIADVAEWLATGADGCAHRVVPPAPAGPIVVGTTATGQSVIETPSRLGPLGLFGMTTEPSELVDPTPILFLSVANEHHIGPNRLWVDLARQWAAAGRRVIRFDLSGLGDSPTRPGQPEFVARALEHFEDVADVARAVSPSDPTDVAFIGLCSSAYQAIESALVLHPRAIVSINAVLSFAPPEMADGGAIDSRRRVCIPMNALVERFSDENSLSGLRRRFPNLGWTVRNVFAGSRRPAVWLRALARADGRSLFVCGEREMRQMRSGMSSHTFKKLATSGNVDFEFIPELDHGLLREDHREIVCGLMTRFLLGHDQTAANPIEEATAS